MHIYDLKSVINALEKVPIRPSLVMTSAKPITSHCSPRCPVMTKYKKTTYITYKQS